MIRFLTLALLAFVATAAFAGNYGTITGIVKDQSGHPLAGATIRLEKTNQGAISKTDGTFILTGIIPDAYEVSVTVVGHERYKATLVVRENISDMIIILKEKPIQTDTIVVYPSPEVRKGHPSPTVASKDSSGWDRHPGYPISRVVYYSFPIGTWQIWYPASKSLIDPE